MYYLVIPKQAEYYFGTCQFNIYYWPKLSCVQHCTLFPVLLLKSSLDIVQNEDIWSMILFNFALFCTTEDLTVDNKVRTTGFLLNQVRKPVGFASACLWPIPTDKGARAPLSGCHSKYSQLPTRPSCLPIYFTFVWYDDIVFKI